jgi:hypothetical protein
VDGGEGRKEEEEESEEKERSKETEISKRNKDVSDHERESHCEWMADRSTFAADATFS